MPTLVVENVPVEIYERLQLRAAAGRRSLPEEMLDLLGQLTRDDLKPTPRLPDLEVNGVIVKIGSGTKPSDSTTGKIYNADTPAAMLTAGQYRIGSSVFKCKHRGF